MNRGIGRARRELAAARLLIDHTLCEPAVSRAYCAAFYAAESALLVIGETRSKHSGVLSAFGRHVVLVHGLDPEIGRLLHRLFTMRGEADHSFDAVEPATAERALSDAARVVDAVERWIADRPS